VLLVECNHPTNQVEIQRGELVQEHLGRVAFLVIGNYIKQIDAMSGETNLAFLVSSQEVGQILHGDPPGASIAEFQAITTIGNSPAGESEPFSSLPLPDSAAGC